MGRSYSMDLRQRVVSRVAGGQSRRGAADDLSVSPSFSVKLVARHQRTGSFEPAPQGRPPGTGVRTGYMVDRCTRTWLTHHCSPNSS
jgi:transposase